MTARAPAPWKRGDPIVVFGDDWGRNVSSMQHVFRHIARESPVVWVNAIGHRTPSLNAADLRRAIQKVRAMTRPAAPAAKAADLGGARPAVIVEPRVLPWHGNPAVHALNTTLLVRAIRRALGALGTTRPPALVTGSPPSVGVVGRLGEAASLYFCMDDFLHLPGVSADMIGPLERRLLARVDAVVATAQSLTESKRPASGLTHYLPQGVNYEHFAAPQEEPADLRELPRPRIGFAGGISACVDGALVRRIAEAWPQASVVLVGPVVPGAVDPALLAKPNIRLLGPRAYADLPGYVQQFDVAIIPYLLNEWTRAVDPLKLLEYLAAGSPVVTSAIPEVRKYAAAVAIAQDDDAFLAAIGAALGADRARSKADGQALARRNTWQHRADDLVEFLEQVAARRAPSPAVAAGR